MRVDPAIQQLFDESSADLRRRMSDLGAELEESKERHAQRTKEITERFAAEERALLDKFENAMEKPQTPTAARHSGVGEHQFFDDDEEAARPQPQGASPASASSGPSFSVPPLSPVAPALPAQRPRAARPAPVDDDEDYSQDSWLS
ncbi:hypothetical protein [Streptoalloteichus hindustanus]|uniref:Uncharacterized protein n=1 Tax=Streptoalloteichus hindustanus TaxID=2017 RepID=A0A1M4TCD9_STRHI|nr:hypothetical protein [Streptoalloteichus hindustanus]SHE42054.1 hypothetical protein SAMN05444320_10141 [Streptoalloteichus hindustanus]